MLHTGSIITSEGKPDRLSNLYCNYYTIFQNVNQYSAVRKNLYLCLSIWMQRLIINRHSKHRLNKSADENCIFTKVPPNFHNNCADEKYNWNVPEGTEFQQEMLKNIVDMKYPLIRSKHGTLRHILKNADESTMLVRGIFPLKPLK